MTDKPCDPDTVADPVGCLRRLQRSCSSKPLRGRGAERRRFLAGVLHFPGRSFLLEGLPHLGNSPACRLLCGVSLEDTRRQATTSQDVINLTAAGCGGLWCILNLPVGGERYPSILNRAPSFRLFRASIPFEVRSHRGLDFLAQPTSQSASSVVNLTFAGSRRHAKRRSF